jgi:hypothetical protein
MPIRMIIVTNSASELAPIFSMTRPRCTLIVFSTVPRSAAICLLIWPAMRRHSTSCSREVRVDRRLRISAVSARTESKRRRAKRVRKCRNRGHQCDMQGRGTQRVQRPIDSRVVGPNTTSRDYHCQPESSEDGVSQCEPGRGLFRSLSHGGSGRF